MKKLLMLFFLCCASLLQGQGKAPSDIEKNEKEIEIYISKEIKTFKLPPETIKDIRETLLMESKEHSLSFDEEIFEKTIISAKHYELKKKFFKKYPRKKILNRPSNVKKSTLQICNNGDFENGNPNDDYTFWHFKSFSSFPGGYNLNTLTTTAFDSISASNIPNSFNSFATIVDNTSPNRDPAIDTTRVQFGNRAIKLNGSTNFGPSPGFVFSGLDITTMRRRFTVNENFIDYNFSLILQNPNHNPPNQKPFFAVRVYDTNFNILRQNVVFSDPNDCMFRSVTFEGDQTLYTGWKCDRIDVRDFINQDVILEFIIADCSQTGHFGTVYIDNICGTNCASPLSGSINLNSIPTIFCPTTTQTICGTYELPLDSQYDNIFLTITRNGVIIATIPMPTTLNQTDQTFCFNVPASLFGPNPNGNYEFQVQGNFIRQCTLTGGFPLDPIFDNSANDTGPDVTFNNCIDAVNDTVIYSTCTLGSFSVLSNDTVFGSPATTGNTIITQISPVIPQLTLNTATGQVTVNSGTAPGVYMLWYKICNLNNSTQCDSAIATVTVTPPILNATNDDFSASPINACVGGTTSTVFSNDSYCGVFLNPSLFNVTLTNNGGLIGATISNSGNITVPASVAPGNYTLTYQLCQIANPSNCDTATVIIKVNPGVTPIFNFPTAICGGSVPPVLPTISVNGIQGTWNPSVISNTAPGNYTFTPVGQCAVPVTIPVTLIPGCGIFISWGSDVSCQLTEEDPHIKFSENIADGPCIRVCENSTITYTLTGDIGTIDHTVWNVTGGDDVIWNNTSITITWTSAAFCALQGIIYLTDGTTKEINKCIEKLEAPTALFGVFPNLESLEIYGCINNPINFENLTTSGGGNEVIYYNWDFGDGTFSNEFEPSHTYDNPGTYTVTLVAYNGCSCADKYTAEVTIREGSVPIACPSVVCEGAVAHYSIPKEYGENCRIEWEATGGEVVATYTSDTEVDVVWNHIDQDGFGYLTLNSDCFHCPTTIKVPVVQLHGKIKGVTTMCVNTQNIFSLPKWPTTEFNWTLNDNSTGAVLLYNNQRNEVIIKSGTHGTIELLCNYKNTLLGCGGTAKITIEVKPLANLVGSLTVCPNTNVQYEIHDENGNNINIVDWVITGPAGFSENGSGSPFDFSFPAAGVYNFSTTSSNYCTTAVFNVNVLDDPAAPTVITGPLTICPGVPVNYSCTPPAGAVTHWQVTNGDIIGSSTGNQIVVNFNPFPSGAFEVKAWYEFEGCQSSVYAIMPTIEVPDLTLLQNTSLVCGSSYATYAVSNSLLVDNYTWSVDPPSAGSVQSGQNSNEVMVLWNQTPGMVNLKLEVRKCGRLFEQLYPVQIINTAQVTINAPATVCSNVATPLSFSMSPGTAFTNVTWDFGDGTPPITTTGNTINHQFIIGPNAVENLIVTATVTGANGCQMPAVATHQIQVSPTPEITVTPATNLDLCDPNNTPADYTYSATMQGGVAGTVIVEWFSGTYPLGVSIGTNPTITLNAVGTYYAIVTNSLGCTKKTRDIRVFSSCPLGSGGCTTANNLDAQITNIGCQSIMAEVTLVEGTPHEVFWSDFSAIGGNAIPNATTLQIDNIEPGEYSITLNASYNVGGNLCYNDKQFTFIVPYKANLRYNITCGSSGMYNVTLYDFSTYYPATPATSFEFSVDDGNSWQPWTPSGGIAQLLYQLAPGTHNVGIRISRPGYPSCQKIIPLVLPAMPSAAFHFDNNACQGTAMRFYANDTTDGLQYHWNFGGGAINIQRDPVRTFADGVPQDVTLTVKNKYGCTVSLTQQVNVLDVRLQGELFTSPVDACQGSTTQIEYIPGGSQEMPTLFNWYYNEYTPVPFATTTTPNLTVSQSGQYFVYVTDANGCSVYNNPPVSAIFVPAPEPPKVSGPTVVCSGNPFSIKVPQNNGVRYLWLLNGIAQPQWNNLNAISTMQTALGTYTYQVVAQVQDGSGNYCTSNPVTHTVTIINQPELPQLEFNVLSCNPYQVEVKVLNPQSGISYYWSNGNTGTVAYSYHDGPIQVRAATNDCSVTAQIDLPIDLESVAWVFPKGCYEFCKEKLEGYIVGPFGYYQQWQWQENNGSVNQGTDVVEPFDQFSPGHDYQMYLNNGYCDYTAATMSVSRKECEDCKISYVIRQIRCVKIDGVYIYTVDLAITNQYGTDVWTTLTAPDGEGYFIDNTLLVPGSATTVFTVYFYAQNGFNGGSINLDILGSWKGNGSCYKKTSIQFPYCLTPRVNENSEVQDTLLLENDLLLVAPNPAQENTTVIYGYKNSEGNKTIEIREMQGRLLNTWQISEQKGTFAIDCTHFAGGQYLIFMKESGAIIKQSRLIINH